MAAVARRWSWLLVLAVGSAAYAAELLTVQFTGNPHLVPSLMLLGSTVVPASVLAYAAWGGPGALLPAGVLAGIVLAGGVLGTVAAGVVEHEAVRELGALPVLLLALVEETAKLLVPGAVLVLGPWRDPRVGVVVGVSSAAGFAALETMGYAFVAWQGSTSLAAVDQTLLWRGLLSPAGHVAWTGVVAAAVWTLPTGARPARAGAMAATALAAAVVLHATWDGSQQVTIHAAIAAVSFTALMTTISRAHRGPVTVAGPHDLSEEHHDHHHVLA